MSVAFAYPYDLHVRIDRPSHLRPSHMYSAMSAIVGDELISCLGKNRFSRVNTSNITSLYMESINRPLKIQKLLEGRIDIYSDYKALRMLKKRGVKLSIFYRDGYWAGDLYEKQMPLFAPELLRRLYQQDWEFIKETFDVIYLPSIQLAEYMGEKKLGRYQELYPGCANNPEALKIRLNNKQTSNKLRLLYVGSIDPSIYNISQILDVFGNKQNVEIVICVRASDVNKYGKFYNEFNYSNIRLEIGKTGSDLQKYYEECDAALLIYSEHPYRKLAMPYKAFEAFGFGVPVIASSGTAFSDMVNRNGIGIVADNNELLEMADDPVNTKKRLYELLVNVHEYAVNNTWKARALQVIKDLE